MNTTKTQVAEEPAYSLMAEDIAQGCRDVAETLLTKNGPDLAATLAPLLEGMVESVRSTITDGTDTGSALPTGRNGQELTGVPKNPPRLSKDGSVRLNSSPVRSSRNLIAPPATLERGDGYSECRVVLPVQYQGPPRSVQGGYCAVLLDDVMWDAVHVARPGIAFTRTLSVEYLRPVPLYQEITMEGRVVKIEGRKIFAEGTLTDSEGQVCTTATGLWLTPREA